LFHNNRFWIPHHTKKRHSVRRRSNKSYSKRPTHKEHGFLIRQHQLPLKGKQRSMKNIHQSVYRSYPNLLRSVKQSKRNKEAANMNAMRNIHMSRPTHSRAAKSAYQERREAEKVVEEMEKQEQKEKKERKAAHASAMSNLNVMMSKMHF
jgi:hypothetical protein